MQSKQPSALSPQLEEGLNGLTVPQLKWLAQVLFVGPPTRKGELVHLLARTLSDPAEVRRLWGLLSPVEKQVIVEAVHRLDGRYESARLAAKYPGAPSPSLPRYSGYGDKRQGTLFDVFFCYLSEGDFFVPGEVAAVVRAIAPEPGPMQIAGANTPPTRKRLADQGHLSGEVAVATTEGAVFHDMATTLQLIRAGKIAVGTSQLPSLASLRFLGSHLQIDDYLDDADYDKAEDAIRPLALVVLAQAAKWAVIPGRTKGGRLDLTKTGQTLLGQPLEAGHIRQLWESWLKSDILDELSRVRNIKGQQSKRTHLTRPVDRRFKMARALSACPVGQWVELGEFFRFLQAEGLDPNVERGEDTGLYVGYSAEYGWLGYTSRTGYWSIVVGSYVRALLMEYVATLGLVDIAYTDPKEAEMPWEDLSDADDLEYLSRYDGLLAFRLTGLGAYVLGLTDEYAPPTPVAGRPFLRVLPNLDLVVVDAAVVAPNERAFLEKVGVEQSKDVYRLNRDRLIEAAEYGLSIAQVVAFLSAKSGLSAEALPQTVSVFLTDVAKRLAALRDGGKVVVLEADDEYLLVELAHNASLREVVRLGEIDGKPVLLVPEEKEATVRRQLKKLGYLPQKGYSSSCS